MSLMSEEEIKKHKENPNILLKVQGKNFRCFCGCNVFHHEQCEDGTMESNEYFCNCCNQRYFSD